MKKYLCIKIPPWIMTTSKILILVLLISLCGVINTSCDGDGKEDGTAKQDAADVKIDYLNLRIAELEASLVSVKSNAYVSEAAYRLKVDELEKEIERLKKEAGHISTDSRTEEFPITTPVSGDDTVTPKPSITFRYSIENGKATITGYTGSADTLVIPSKIGGYEVEKIGDEAFSRTSFTNIIVEDGIKYIGWFAFSENVALKSITLPDSVVKAEYGLFNGCTSKLTVRCSTGSYMSVYAASYGISVKGVDKNK